MPRTPHDATRRAARRLGLKEKYALMTRDLGWDTSYQAMDDVFPVRQLRRHPIHDWDEWEDPFRLTMDAYWKFQGEKEKKLYAIIDAFQQNNGQFNVTDARYINTIKLFLTGVSPLEYAAHRGYAMAGRNLRGVGPRIAAQMQSIDELRHAQTQVHTISHYNKYFNGLHDFHHMHDRVWYLSVPKSYFDDAMSAGPFEFITAISFSFEYVLTNLLFMPFMSGAAFNGDMATVTFGFSAQSDESRHMTLGLEVVKFMLEQDPANLPIIQKWIDKWFWRGYRLLTLVAMMMDYMLPKRVMSWAEAWEIYFEKNGGALFEDLARYGVRMPKYHEVASKEKDRLSHMAWGIFYNYTQAAAFHTWVPEPDEMDWLAQKYPRPSTSSTARASSTGPAGEGGQALGEQRAADALPGLPDPDGLHRARRPDADLPARVELPRHEVPLLLRRLQGHLRRRAREVRAGLAAGAPDLPGQLLPRRRRPDRRRLRPAGRGAGVLRHQPRRRRRRIQRLARQANWDRWTGRTGLRKRTQPEGEPHARHRIEARLRRQGGRRRGTLPRQAPALHRLGGPPDVLLAGVPPAAAAMPFGALVAEVLPTLYGSHPDFAQIDWEAEWRDSGKPFMPDFAKSLADNGLVHKSAIRFRTPGLNGIGGSTPEAEGAAMSYQITIEPIGQTVESARARPCSTPACAPVSGCRTPAATACAPPARCRWSTARCDHGEASNFALMDFERDEGKILACCATAQSDLVIEADVEEDPDAAYLPLDDFLGRVVEARMLTPTIRGLWLEPTGRCASRPAST